jgi:hypothetical protein
VNPRYFPRYEPVSPKHVRPRVRRPHDVELSQSTRKSALACQFRCTSSPYAARPAQQKSRLKGRHGHPQKPEDWRWCSIAVWGLERVYKHWWNGSLGPTGPPGRVSGRTGAGGRRWRPGPADSTVGLAARRCTANARRSHWRSGGATSAATAGKTSRPGVASRRVARLKHRRSRDSGSATPPPRRPRPISRSRPRDLSGLGARPECCLARMG